MNSLITDDELNILNIFINLNKKLDKVCFFQMLDANNKFEKMYLLTRSLVEKGILNREIQDIPYEGMLICTTVYTFGPVSDLLKEQGIINE